ncbi:D-aspartate oxidase-like isoform X2 [Dendronephthya gigantea]|uniref:D-aspartate oxidase-like isoform X2 n=1 Tax=Dendronephthya gigantea TaxID=151771 RepID=UPI00106D05D2|nr:D-aspartate oxidase-like isoform X2 [Dendronephthya gigantea]
MASGKKVAIIGAGICGISSAICLQDADPTLDLTIIADQFSPNLTSDVAAGFWDPVFLKNTPLEKQRIWGKATFDYLRTIVDTEEAFKYQMNYVTAYELYDEPAKESPFSDIFLYFKRLSKEELQRNFPNDIINGFVMKSIMIPGTPYITIKLKEFQQKGGNVVQKKLISFDELAGRYDVVVNCTGLGAYNLCQDASLIPWRGQVLKMKAPWLKHAYICTKKNEEKQGLVTYIFPRFNDVVVGGTIQSDNWDTCNNEEEIQAIIDRAAELEPTIKKAELIKAMVGLRPVRNGIRLEKEVMKVSTQYGTRMKLQVVHNYGHGGAGLSLFWGCAQELFIRQ